MRKQTKLLLGDNIESLSKLPDNSIDSIVTDPPYGLKFMGKKWDYQVPSVEFWKEVYRVLKPGGHVLSFGGTRTYHRMVVNLEDGGFEIRDCISWIYGSGFPKSLNIGKAVDKIQGNEREIGDSKGTYVSSGGQLLGENIRTERFETKGTTPYEGQGTALKPAQELICMARKPISEKTIAENVMKWGTGGLNIDGSRIGTEVIKSIGSKDSGDDNIYGGGKGLHSSNYNNIAEGRFPANIILDDEAGKMLDEQSCQASSRYFYSAKVSKRERNMGLDGFEDKPSQLNFGGIGKISVEKRLESNGENAPTMKNTHPTLKPITLMSYLINLVTPKNGIVLDPFMGSGSTGIAALLNGYRFCGMEMNEEYFKIAEARINNYELYREFLDKKPNLKKH